MRRLNPISRGRRAKTLQKLYDYWVDEDTPFTGDAPDDSRLNIKEGSEGKTPDEYGLSDWKSLLIQRFKGVEQDTNSVWFSLPIRYVLQGVAIISLLLITLSVVSTILIAQSC